MAGRAQRWCDRHGERWAGPIGITIFSLVCLLNGLFVVVPGLDESVRPWFRGAILSCAGLVFVNLVAVHEVDPGVIKRGPGPRDEDAHERSKHLTIGEPLVRTISINGKDQEERYCRACEIWRPPRATHCYTCNHCVMRFDHHCPVLGSCIAQRSYRFFLMLLAFAGLGGIVLCIATFLWIVRLDPFVAATWQSGTIYGAFILLLLYIYLATVFVFFCGHCCLVLADTTTKERYGRQQKRGRCSCFGLYGFCLEVCCSPIACRDHSERAPRNDEPGTTLPDDRRREAAVLAMAAAQPLPAAHVDAGDADRFALHGSHWHPGDASPAASNGASASSAAAVSMLPLPAAALSVMAVSPAAASAGTGIELEEVVLPTFHTDDGVA